jgi:hypothetical protein
MFMIVTYPWPVASAHVDLTRDGATTNCDAIELTIERRARLLEETVNWTDLERLRIQWYRLRLAIGDVWHK